SPPGSDSEGLAYARAERLQDFDPGNILVVGGDQGPGRNLGAGLVDHVTHGPLVSLPPVPVAPVLLRDLEALEPGLLALFEAPQLLVLADVQPELHHHTAIADQDRKSTRLNSSHSQISYAVFCLKKKKKQD